MPRTAAVFAFAFGLLALIAGKRSLFGGAYMGTTVGFDLVFNFLAGFAYVVAGVGLWGSAP